MFEQFHQPLRVISCCIGFVPIVRCSRLTIVTENRAKIETQWIAYLLIIATIYRQP